MTALFANFNPFARSPSPQEVADTIVRFPATQRAMRAMAEQIQRVSRMVSAGVPLGVAEASALAALVGINNRWISAESQIVSGLREAVAKAIRAGKLKASDLPPGSGLAALPIIAIGLAAALIIAAGGFAASAVIVALRQTASDVEAARAHRAVLSKWEAVESARLASAPGAAPIVPPIAPQGAASSPVASTLGGLGMLAIGLAALFLFSRRRAG